MCDVATRLGTILKQSFRKSGETETLRDSLLLVDSYLAVWSVIYPGKLTYKVDAEPGCLDTLIPSFLLQPIVENAVIHGLEPKVGAGKLCIRIYWHGSDVWINVWDDGVGMPKAKLDTILTREDTDKNGNGSHGFGLYNVNKRIQLQFGGEYGLTLESVERVYTSVTVTVPGNEERT